MALEYNGTSGQETRCVSVDYDDDGTPYINQRKGDMKRVHVSKVLWDETMSGTILVVGTWEQTTRPNAADRTAPCGFDKYKEPRLKE